MIRYGKPNAAYLRLRSAYFDVDASRNQATRAAKASGRYAEQPRRAGCVVCQTPVGAATFRFLGAAYAICGDCGHLNGLTEDTLQFSRFLYEDGHIDVTAYRDESRDTFMSRVATVYRPKAQFLVDALRELNEDPGRLRYADLGAGAGHFVVGLQECGLTNSIGYETDAGLVESTNRRFGREILRHNRIEQLALLAETVEADVITMIFSLEHVHDLRGFMSALRRNRTLRHFYFAVPMFSPSTILDVAFPKFGPRTIGLGHTHLFSQSSLDRLCSVFGLHRTAEWWFGGNAFDVIRNIAVTLRANPETTGLAEAWQQQMFPITDDLQLAFDKHKLSSEIHLLATLNR